MAPCKRIRFAYNCVVPSPRHAESERHKCELHRRNLISSIDGRTIMWRKKKLAATRTRQIPKWDDTLERPRRMSKCRVEQQRPAIECDKRWTEVFSKWAKIEKNIIRSVKETKKVSCVTGMYCFAWWWKPLHRGIGSTDKVRLSVLCVKYILRFGNEIEIPPKLKCENGNVPEVDWRAPCHFSIHLNSVFFPSALHKQWKIERRPRVRAHCKQNSITKMKNKKKSEVNPQWNCQ